MSQGGGGMRGPGERGGQGVKSPFLELPSKPTFFAGAFGMFSAGALAGVYQIMRREKFSFDMRAHRTPFAVASKALLLGTALCVGSFAAGTAAMVATTGITSFEEFGVAVSKRMAAVESLQTKDAEILADLNKIRQLSEKQEMDYWWERLFAPAPPAADASADASVGSSGAKEG